MDNEKARPVVVLLSEQRGDWPAGTELGFASADRAHEMYPDDPIIRYQDGHPYGALADLEAEGLDPNNPGDLETLTKAQLAQVAAVRGVTIPKDTKKADIVSMLQEAVAPPPVTPAPTGEESTENVISVERPQTGESVPE